MSCQPAMSVLQHIERQFQALASSPWPSTIDGFEIGHGFPDRALSLIEVRDLLAARTATHDMKDAVWSLLVRRARSDCDTWGAIAAGMMLRGLRNIAFRVSRGVEFRRQDLESEVLLGFCEALRSIDPSARGIAGLLWWAAYRRGLAARFAEQQASGWELTDSDMRRQNIIPPEGHPDLVLAKAVGEGVLDSGDAALIGDTRVEGQTLIVASDRAGLSYWSCHKRRARAERRLARYLGHRSGVRDLAEDDPSMPDAA